MLGIHPNKYIYTYILILLSWEAVDNVGNVMTNLLRVQSKMENLRGKLAALEKSDEQEQIHSWYLYRCIPDSISGFESAPQMAYNPQRS